VILSASTEAALRDEDPDESIEPLVATHGWPSVREQLMAILEDPARTPDEWSSVALVFWGAVLDRREVNADRLIALLYARLPNDRDSSESNLAWSIASKLRGLAYDSTDEPLGDPRVQAQLASIATRREGQ
jgi:hypothetical protein